MEPDISEECATAVYSQPGMREDLADAIGAVEYALKRIRVGHLTAQECAEMAKALNPLVRLLTSILIRIN